MLHDGIYEGIISETDWELAHQKREKTGVKYEKMCIRDRSQRVCVQILYLLILSCVGYVLSVSYTHLITDMSKE